MPIRISQKVGAALFFMAFGALALWLGRGLEAGTAGEMGVGYTPRMLAFGCIGIGVLLLAQGLIDKERAAIVFSPGPALFVTILVLAFAALLPWAGLPLTILIVTLMAGASGEKLSWPWMAATAVLLSLGSTALFVWLLQLQVPVWPAW